LMGSCMDAGPAACLPLLSWVQTQRATGPFSWHPNAIRLQEHTCTGTFSHTPLHH